MTNPVGTKIRKCGNDKKELFFLKKLSCQAAKDDKY